MQRLNQAIGALQRGEFKDAERLLRSINASDAKNFDALHMLGIACSAIGKISDAEKFFQAALTVDSKYPPCFHNYGLFLAKQNRHRDAIQQFDKAISLARNFAPAYSDRGNSLQELGRLEESIASFDTAATLAPNVPIIFNNRANSYFKKGNYELALRDYDKAIALNPNYAEAHCGRGNVFTESKRYREALDAYDKALAMNSHLAEIWLGRGNIFAALRRYDEALSAYDKALALNAYFGLAWVGRGCVFQARKRYSEALESFDRALAINLSLSDAWLNRGDCFNDLGRCNEALGDYGKALALKPDLAEAWLGRANAFVTLKRYGEALDAYDKALALKPNLIGAEGARLHTKMLLCDWRDFDAECEHLIASVMDGKTIAGPLVILSIPSTPAEQLRCIQRYVAETLSIFPPMWQGERYTHDRIRVAYVSTDYRDHPIAYLISEVFELHDRDKFEIVGISLGADDKSTIRARIVKAFDQFNDVQNLGDDAAAELIKRLKIDIAVDLNNYTSQCRPGILARRPAPVQVSYLGYPATMGGNFIDYAIADKFVLPNDQHEFWTEKIVHLPDSYLAHDTVTKRNMPAEPTTRAQAGLPENAFVFCCFNNIFKLTPVVFQVWLRLLKAVDGSVAWFSAVGEPARINLGNAARQAGVDPERLIFAPRVERVEDHLSRHRVADLFLDMLPYNAHTTAADALWAGLPIVTCAGQTFPGRVAGSLLHAIGLPELVTQNLQEYEALALKLARDPAQLASIKAKLARNRDTYPLFDTARFTRHLEAAYLTMVERQRRGEQPAPFAVDPIA